MLWRLERVLTIYRLHHVLPSLILSSRQSALAVIATSVTVALSHAGYLSNSPFSGLLATRRITFVSPSQFIPFRSSGHMTHHPCFSLSIHCRIQSTIHLYSDLTSFLLFRCGMVMKRTQVKSFRLKALVGAARPAKEQSIDEIPLRILLQKYLGRILEAAVCEHKQQDQVAVRR